ncbi:hypothetical protein FF1_016732 [Malus domestica]
MHWLVQSLLWILLQVKVGNGSSLPAQEIPAEKKPKTSFARAGSLTASRLVIDLTFSKGMKNEAARSEHVASAISRMASTIADRIVRHKGSVMLLVLNFVPRRLLGAKSCSSLERLAIMKNDKVDSAAKVAPRPILYAAETDSPAGNEETACVGSCEKSTKLASGGAAEIYMLLKPDLLKTWTLVPSLLMASERYSKVAKETANTMADSELVALKGSHMSTPTPLQLEIARQKIVDLKTRLDEIQIQDLEFAVSELCFAAYAKDEKLIAAYNQINESLKKEVDELQSIHVGLLEEDKQLKVGEVSAQAGAAKGEAPDDTAVKSVAAAEGVATK